MGLRSPLSGLGVRVGGVRSVSELADGEHGDRAGPHDFLGDAPEQETMGTVTSARAGRDEVRGVFLGVGANDLRGRALSDGRPHLPIGPVRDGLDGFLCTTPAGFGVLGPVVRFGVRVPSAFLASPVFLPFLVLRSRIDDRKRVDRRVEATREVQCDADRPLAALGAVGRDDQLIDHRPSVTSPMA